MALAAGLAAIPVWIVLARDRTFAVDEWSFVEPRSSGGLDTVLERHNEHIVVIPALIYRALFETVGIDHAWPYRLVVLAMHVACAALLFSLVRRRAGAWPAAFAAILLLWALDRDRPGLAASVDVRPTSPPCSSARRRRRRWSSGASASGTCASRPRAR